MSGELSAATFEIAAEVAIRQAISLKDIANAWETVESPVTAAADATLEMLRRGDKAAVAAALPQVMQQLAQLQEQASG